MASIFLVAPYGCSKGEQAQNAPGQEAAQADPGKEHFEKGVQHSLKGELDEAIKEYETVLTYNPQSAEAYNNLGFAFYDKGAYDKAVESQKKAIEMNPNFAYAYYGLALALEKTGDKKGALENWKQFSNLAQPHSKWWTKAQERIQALEGKGSKTQAKK
ncbi:MAG: hypothetical protein A2V21_309000 [Deltaproteobacteria bacterium GWC2_55_46]|nr:MAG: hypothetical protein A3I81_05010 [Deltaproteobacteria bacterium RIFCSPLOWO2_02_FULL_55_12]OIJ74382.1 MAG: hypothetical protein A2V21_309000 [Deltaproteobacteria bacterium GWC2_55_46]